MSSQDTNELNIFGLNLTCETPSPERTPFAEHAQLQQIIDIIIRRFHHHAMIDSQLGKEMHLSFIKALAQKLIESSQPNRLKQAQIHYFELAQIWQKPQAKQSLQAALRQIKSNTLPLKILCFNTQQALEGLNEFIAPLLQCEHIRIILFNKDALEPQLQQYFASIKLGRATLDDCFSLLKQQCIELEEYHHIIISQEILEESYTLARRYLNQSNTTLNTLLLLDTAAARSNQNNSNESTLKSILCSQDLYQVLSTWTGIPKENLSNNPINSGRLLARLQQRLINQSTATHFIQQHLQHTLSGLEDTPATVANFLLTGPKHTGKKILANCLCQEIYGHLNALYFIDLNHRPESLYQIKAQRQANLEYMSLAQALDETPYAIFYFEGLEECNENLISDIIELLSTGEINLPNEEPLNFKQAILLFSTQFGAEKLNQIYAPKPQSQQVNQLDLMQLMQHETSETTTTETATLNTDVILEYIKKDIKSSRAACLLKHFHIIPFMPIARDGIEKIIHAKLEEIGAQLNLRYGIQFTYAAEVIPFLTEESIEIQQHQQDNHFEHAMQQLYLSIEQSILAQEHHTHNKQLFLQLNETGEVLRCHWLDTQPVATANLHQVTL